MIDRFVQIEAGLPASKLIDGARESLGCGKALAVGLFTNLWLATIVLKTRGLIGDRSDRWIEEAAGWEGEPGRFAQFVRHYHLDAEGVVKDWLTKYGKLDQQRAKEANWKRDQRSRPLDSPDGVHDMSSGHGDDGPRILSYSPSSSLVLSSPQEGQELEGVVGREERPTEHPAIALVLSKFGEHSRWLLGLVRSARFPEAVAAELCAHLEGMHGPKYEPKVVGFAAQQWLASKHAAGGFEPAFFAGFVRRAQRTFELKPSRVAALQEERFITAEDIEAERAIREEAATREMLVEFERRTPSDFASLKRRAEAAVPEKVSGMFREPMVRSHLVNLVRQAMTGAMTDGGNRVAS